MEWEEPEPEMPMCPAHCRRWAVLTLDEDDYEYKPLRLARGYFRSLSPAIRHAMILQWLRPDLTVVVESVINKTRLSVRRWVDREMKAG